MSRQKLRIPTRNFKIRGRSVSGVQSREEIRRNREVVGTEAVVEEPIAPAPDPVPVAVPAPVAPVAPPVTTPHVEPTPRAEKPATPLTPPVPLTPPMNPSRGVYVDTVKKPTLSSNARVEIASPSVDAVKNEQFKSEFAQSLKNETNVEEKSENLKSNTGKDVKAAKPAKKKKFLFW